jgi:leader peptidase (prepilin peptidase)/N-methyltransferase
VSTWVPAAVAALLTGLVVTLLTRPVLARLPEPSDAEDKPAYAELGTVAFVGTCALVSMAAQLLAWTMLPTHVQPLWTVLALCAVLLAAIDARTTWLPLRLTRAGWLLMLVGVGLSLLFGATLGDAARALAGAAVAGTVYLLLWMLTRGGFGFGDVRYAPLLGAATAGVSWSLLMWGLALGSLVGAVHGMFRLVGRRAGAFPYAPSMLLGSYLSVALLYLVPTGAG